MGDGLPLNELAKTDPVLQRALEFHRVLAQALARDYSKEFREICATNGFQAALVWGGKMQEPIMRKAAEYESEAGIAGLGEQYLAYFREERERLDQEFPLDPSAVTDWLGELTPGHKAPAESDGQRKSASERSDSLTLEERAVTDPALQRVLKTYREMCHSLAQDYWREFLELSVTRGREAVLIYMTQFQEMIARKATEFEAESGIAGLGERYLAYIQEERDRLLQEYQRDPAALRRSLGAPSLPQMPAPTQHTSQRMPIGEMAVRTAVRATVWTLVRDAIRSILR